MTDTTTEPLRPVNDDPDLTVPDPDLYGDRHRDCDHASDNGEPCPNDSVYAGWDVGMWTRLNFTREGDGTFNVSVNAAREALTARSCTAEQLRALARHLLVVAGDPA